MRKVARQFTKILSMDDVGYLVFPIPFEMRHLFIFPEWLHDMGKYCRRMIQRELPVGKYRGFSRWHFSGDCRRCNGKGILHFQKENETVECPECEGSGLNNKWHPHLNILIDVGHIDAEILERIKKLYRAWLENYTGIKLENKKAVVLYRYYSDDSFTDLRIRYRVCRYALRPTFSERTCIEYERLYGMDPKDIFNGFRNVCEIGRHPKGYFFDTKNLPVNVCKFIFSKKKYRRLFQIGKGNGKCACPICAEELQKHDHGKAPDTFEDQGELLKRLGSKGDHMEAREDHDDLFSLPADEDQGDLLKGSPWGPESFLDTHEPQGEPEPQEPQEEPQGEPLPGTINYVTFEMIIRTPRPWTFDQYGICELSERQYVLASEWSRKPIMLQ